MPDTEFEVRTVDPADYEPYVRFAYRQFHASTWHPSEADTAFRARNFADCRATAGYAGDRMVGTFLTWDAPLAVPGGLITADYVSLVTVSPTHRRRGVLTAMMTADLRQAKESGTALAYLIASSAQIYGRYGYGVCTEHATWTVDADATRFRLSEEAAGLTVELTDDAGLAEIGPAVHEAAYIRQPGAKPRDELWWQASLGLAGLTQDEPHAVRDAIYVLDGENPVAYARYRVKDSSEQRVDTSRLEVRDLSASTDAGYARVWQFLASIDLVSTLSAADRSVEEPLPWLLTDRRSARQSQRADFSWARLLDVAKALSNRRYLGAGSCVLEVIDRAGLAGGRFRLEAEESGVGRATATTDRADVTLDVSTLGSAYLGEISLHSLAAAGLVEEHTDGAVRRLSALLRFPATTWSTHTWF
jgi:predicted acetyltransferase